MLSETKCCSITELWNGAIWTETNDLNVAREGGSPAGTSTAGLVVQGGNMAINNSSHRRMEC